METIGPHVRTIPVRCAPRKAPCPNCGKPGRRKAIHHRLVRTIAYKQVVFLDVTYGEYRARCSCSRTFRTTPPDVEPKALYDNKVRRAVIDRILDDGMSVERVIASMSRDFLPGPLRRLRLRLPPPGGPASGHGRAPPLGPGALQRHALRR